MAFLITDPKRDPPKNTLWFTQNFIHSKKLANNLVSKVGFPKDINIIEIGAGKGIFSQILKYYATKLYLVEKDHELAQKLRVLFTEQESIKIMEQDFLKLDLNRYTNYSIFGNIPFNITADITRKLVLTRNKPKIAALIIQLEAAERLMGLKNDRIEESVFSLKLKSYYRLEIIQKLHPFDFKPAPRVSSVLLKFSLKKENKNIKLFNLFLENIFVKSPRNLEGALKMYFTKNQLFRLSKVYKMKLSPSQISFEKWEKIFETFMELNRK